MVTILFGRCGVLFFWVLLMVARVSYADPVMSYVSSRKNFVIKRTDGISFESLKQQIEDSKIDRLENLLQVLPADYLNHYVLMYRSRSLQGASFLNPRVIVFGESAKFIMAFNGHASQRGYFNLETVEFNDEDNSWEFREITFNEDHSKPTFSKVNPKKCLECHQSSKRKNIDPRPNWEPYNFWPGSYASVDDTVQPVLKKEYESYVTNNLSGEPQNNKSLLFLNRFLPEDMILVTEQSKEQKNLQKFELSKPSHSRYKFLSEFNVRSNLHFTKVLSQLNMRRVARLLKSELGVYYDKYKYALYSLGDIGFASSSEALKYKCGLLQVPETVHKDHLDYSLNVRKDSLKPDKYIAPESITGQLHWKHGLDAGLKILLAPFNIMTEDWSMDFRTRGRFSRSTGDRFTSPSWARQEFREALAYVYPDDASKMSCSQLKSKSETVLNSFAKTQRYKDLFLNTKPLEYKSKPLIQRCQSCHSEVNSDYMDAPFISFHDGAALKVELQKSGYQSGTLLQEIKYRISDHSKNHERMPLSGFVGRKEREEFINYLESL